MLNLIGTAAVLALGSGAVQSAEPVEPPPPLGTYACVDLRGNQYAPELVILGHDHYRDGQTHGRFTYDGDVLRFRSGPFDVRPYGSEWIGRVDWSSPSTPAIEIRDLKDDKVVQRCSLRTR